MDLSGFGLEQLEQGKLNDMLQQVGIEDVGQFVINFRNQAQQSGDDDEDTACRTASSQQANLFSMGSSLLNQFSHGGGGGGGGGDGNNSADMIQGAMKAYNMFSGGKNQSSGGGGFLDNISSSYQNAQKMYALYKQFDKNGDGKITVEDIQIYLQEMGLGFVSPYLAKALFQAVDQNHNGSLDFTDLMALTTLLNKMSGQFGGIQQ
ncbi:unnamed protein product [Rotaria magnacalcarata]|uniref:EF-hand domain-containing protein n=1 Tax=Rotaria magnacalcarata TaxID=392030 RepID=A0A819KMQ3_9BILA|nr:unnamed protein product [Rotaria magnacalcarata]CAF1551479.1 unnamed protein product [Rotaria magnacalcarata]CAF2042078.1 unnamed protein product [Rotaria magnacalcarata]CAF2159978.1 unnamed protein product [Rotaria magnacalcarata]CAF2194404.1 unnamed protein product [Rotaria magnacalcarata]